MTNSAESRARRIAWFDNDDDGTVRPVISRHPLSESEWDEFQDVVGVIAELRPYIIDFLSLRSDFVEFNEVGHLIGSMIADTDPLDLFQYSSTNTMSLVKVQRALSNFLSGASCLRDRAKKRLCDRYGKKSTEVETFVRATNQEYDKWFSYRLLYNLRNYAQHIDSPISIIPVRGDRDAAGSMNISVRIELQRDELIRNWKRLPKLQRRPLQELPNQPSTIPLRLLAEEYMKSHGRIFSTIAHLHDARLHRFQQQARILVEKLPLPQGKLPVIWDGDLPTESGSRPTLHSFSFDDFALLTKIVNCVDNEGNWLSATFRFRWAWVGG